MHWIRHPKDFWAGVLFIAFGTAAVTLGAGYPLGTAARMGPGYFPRVLGMLLIGMGLILALRALKLTGAPLAMRNVKPLVIVLASVLVFGLTATRLGVVAATMLLILISSTADHEYRWKEALVSSLVLAAVTVAAFIWGLGVQLPVWPPFLTGR
jgi:Tripartite tricarboxylate transporter TctB family